jgi:ribosomal protein S18 acetylase RimI-like enzyme
VVLSERPDGIRIIRVESLEDGLLYRTSFAGAYQDIFSELPYQERFRPSEAMGVLRHSLEVPENITLLAVKGRSRVVGFGIGVPAKSQPGIRRAIMGLLPSHQTWYLSELGVLSGFRRTGLGTALIEHRLRLIDRERYSQVVLRVSSSRDKTFEMYLGLGFEDTGCYMEVASRRLNGRVATDRRVFLSKVLGPPDGNT